MTNDQITRRGFLKKSALTGIAVAGAAIVAKIPDVTKAAPVTPALDVPPEVIKYGYGPPFMAMGSGGDYYLYHDA